jgi:GTPase
VACSGALGVYISLTPMRLFACSPGRAVKAFEAQLAIVELLEHKALFTAGYKAVMHCHTVRPSTHALVELLEHKALFTAGYKAVMHCHTVRPSTHALVELLEHKALFTAGYKAVMHCHTVRPSTQRREVELIRFSLASNSSNSSLPLDALVAPLSHTHRVRRGVVGS